MRTVEQVGATPHLDEYPSRKRMFFADTIQELPVLNLAVNCADEMRQCGEHTAREVQYCYELFRRAIVENNQQAWEAIFHQYQKLIIKWVRQRLRLQFSKEDLEDCINMTYSSLAQSLCQPSKFEHFPTTANLLAYLRCCAFSAAQSKNREIDRVSEQLSPNLSGHVQVDSLVIGKLTRDELYRIVNQNLKDERERIVFEHYFEMGLKPAEIFERFTEKFRDKRDVYVVKQVLLERLERVLGTLWQGERLC